MVSAAAPSILSLTGTLGMSGAEDVNHGKCHRDKTALRSLGVVG